MDVGVVKQGFVAGQDSAFREQVALWVKDETISNAEFGKKVSELQWNLMMNRIAFLGELASRSGVDTAPQEQ